MKKKAVKKATGNHRVTNHMVNVRSVIALLIVLLSLSVLMLFRQYQQSIYSSGMYNAFLTLCVVGFGLLVALLFLVNPKK